ncbi:MAG: hypothetical protein AAGF96_18740 [Bacteroidota bacterium]
MKTNYNLSKDYKQLFALLLEGVTAVGFVDYSLHGDNLHPSRDVVKIYRNASFDIRIGSRGIQYGGVDPYWKEIDKEKSVFIKECERMNLQFINPCN